MLSATTEETKWISSIKQNLVMVLLGRQLSRGGPREVAILCDMHSLMPVGFFMYISINGFLPGCLFDRP